MVKEVLRTVWGCCRSCGVLPHCGRATARVHCMRIRACGVLRTLGCYRSWCVLRTVGCCRSWCVLRTLGVLLPQLVWCCRTLGVLPHALCVLAHTWRSAAAAASLVLALSALSSSPSPTGCWAVRREQERAEDKRSQPSATLRRTWSLAIMVWCGASPDG